MTSVFVAQYDSGSIIMVCGSNIPPVLTSAGRTVIVNLVINQLNAPLPAAVTAVGGFGFSLTYKTACTHVCTLSM